MSRGWAWGALVVIVVATVAWVAWPRGPESPEARAERIASELRCVECEGLSVADAATSTARATRAEIRERIEVGESDAEIRQSYVDRYGEWALMNPRGEGVGMLVWALPVVVVAAGGAGIGLAVWRWRRTPRLTATPADERLVRAVPSRVGAGVAVSSGLGVAPLALEGGTLEDERDFLLRSLDDLDAEYAEDNIDAETYATLHADYTARAAAVLRSIEGGEAVSESGQSESGPSVPGLSVSWARRAVVIGVVVAFAVAAGVVLASAFGARLPGGLPTGDDVAIGAEEREQRLRQAVTDNPDDPAVHLALANFLFERDEYAEALPIYDSAARLDPDDPVAPTQAGWLLYLTALSATDSEQHAALLEGARTRLDTAVEIDPDHAEARFFRGLMLFRGYEDAQGAAADLQRFLALDPENPLAEEVRELLAEVLDQAPS